MHGERRMQIAATVGPAVMGALKLSRERVARCFASRSREFDDPGCACTLG